MYMYDLERHGFVVTSALGISRDYESWRRPSPGPQKRSIRIQFSTSSPMICGRGGRAVKAPA